MTYDYNFWTGGRGVSQQAFDMLDANKDGKISMEEENLFDQQMLVKYGQTEDALKFKVSNKFEISRDLSWITDETERAAAGYELSKTTAENMYSGCEWQIRFNDGELTADDNKMLKEMEEMNAIANEFLKANSQYVIGNRYDEGLAAQVGELFDNFSRQNANRSKDIEKMSDEFKAELQKLSTKSMANAAIDSLMHRGGTDVYIGLELDRANKDGVITNEEAKKISDATAETFMARALKGENVEGILKGLLESTTDPNVKKELINMAKQLQELAGQRYLMKPEDFFNKLNNLSTNMADKLNGTNIGDSVNDNRVRGNTLPRTNDVIMHQTNTRAGNNNLNGMISALRDKNEGNIAYVANEVINYFKGKGITLDPTLVKEVIKAMPYTKEYIKDRGLDLSVFVPKFNSTLQNLNTASINAQQIDFAADESLNIKANLTAEDTDPFYRQKTNEAAAQATINGIKGQIKSMAENAYLLKELEFNQELFDQCFSTASTETMNQFKSGNIKTMNEVLNNFIINFNARWVTQSLSDIASKQQQQN
ncbi:hypothetical protein IJE86_02480 [bacterium]|nr:hypothetical protein [bacterium]